MGDLLVMLCVVCSTVCECLGGMMVRAREKLIEAKKGKRKT